MYVEEKKFNPKKRKKLNNPDRLLWIPPQQIATLLQIKAGKQYLDVGAGTGYISDKVVSTAPGTTVYALDIEPVMIEEMERSNLADGLLPQLMERDTLAFEDSSIDGIWSTTVFHELGDPAALLSEMYRVLRPQCSVLIVDWEKSVEACEQGPPLDHRVEEQAVISALTLAGFTEVRSVSGFTFHFGVLATKP